MNKIIPGYVNFESLHKWPYIFQIGIILSLGILITCLGYGLIIRSDIEEFRQLKTLEDNLKKDFEFKQFKASTLHAYISQLHISQDKFGMMLKKLSLQQEIPGLMDEISRRSTGAGLQLMFLTPQQPIPHDFFIEQTLNHTFMGTYEQLMSFLKQLMEMDKIIFIPELSITKSSLKKADEKNMLIIRISITIYTYGRL